MWALTLITTLDQHGSDAAVLTFDNALTKYRIHQQYLAKIIHNYIFCWQYRFTRVIWKAVATVFYFENEARNSMKVYMYSDISIFPPQINLETIWIHRMLHVQDIGKLDPCYDSAWKPISNFKTGVILDEKIFLKTNSFLFSLLCIIHII